MRYNTTATALARSCNFGLEASPVELPAAVRAADHWRPSSPSDFRLPWELRHLGPLAAATA